MEPGPLGSRTCSTVQSGATGTDGGNAYAIPTKDLQIRTLPLLEVRAYIKAFLVYAEAHPKETFQITRVGCGLAGFRDEDIAPLFLGATDNCLFDEAWRTWLPGYQFWGTF